MERGADGRLAEAAVIVVGLAGCLSLIYYYVRTGAPPVASRAAEREAVVALLKGAGLPDGARIYELGCGWGGLCVALARAFPGARVTGVELSPLPWLVARLRVRGLPNARVVRADFHGLDLADADACTAYLMIEPMQRLARTLDRTLRPGTPVVALAFLFRDRVPEAVSKGVGVRTADAARYRWPARADGP